LETIEQRVAEAEAELKAQHDSLLDPTVMSDGAKLHAVSLELEAAQTRIDELYARWVELEDKLK
jgi:ABC transport system ATP-binding/permease protein